MVRNVDIEIFKKSASRGRDFPEQQNLLAPTVQLSKWVWDNNAGADTALEYVNRGVRCREGHVRKQPQMQVPLIHLRLG